MWQVRTSQTHILYTIRKKICAKLADATKQIVNQDPCSKDLTSTMGTQIILRHRSYIIRLLSSCPTIPFALLKKLQDELERLNPIQLKKSDTARTLCKLPSRHEIKETFKNMHFSVLMLKLDSGSWNWIRISLNLPVSRHFLESFTSTCTCSMKCYLSAPEIYHTIIHMIYSVWAYTRMYINNEWHYSMGFNTTGTKATVTAGLWCIAEIQFQTKSWEIRIITSFFILVK